MKIKEFATVITGKTPPTANKSFYGSQYPFITPSDIPTYSERRIYNYERYLSQKGFEFQKKMVIPSDATCFVAIGSTIGKLCLTSETSFTNQQIHSLISKKDKVNPVYLFYLLRYIYPWIKSIADA